MCKSRKKVLNAAKVGGMEIPAAKHQHWSTPGQQVETTGEVFTAAGAKLLFHCASCSRDCIAWLAIRMTKVVDLWKAWFTRVAIMSAPQSLCGRNPALHAPNAPVTPYPQN